MVPRRLNEQVALERLRVMRSLLQTLDRIAVGRALDDVERLALERILTQLVDLAVGINHHLASAMGQTPPTDAKSSFEAAAAIGLISGELAAALGPSVGLRNVLTHEYVAVDQRKVDAAVPLARRHYAEYVASVAQWLAGQAPESS